MIRRSYFNSTSWRCVQTRFGFGHIGYKFFFGYGRIRHRLTGYTNSNFIKDELAGTGKKGLW